MKVTVRHNVHPDHAKTLDTAGLRGHFLIEDMFQADDIVLTYSHVDRVIAGGAVPATAPLKLGTAKEIGSPVFLARRELGVVQVGGGKGRVTADGEVFEMGYKDVLYVAQGTTDVTFESLDAANPTRFYLVSYPALVRYETKLITREAAAKVPMGAPEQCNERVINQYIHPSVLKTCQLLLGITEFKPGSIWNTMPAHTHDRRMEVYFYFDIDSAQRVFHMMGEPTETRHIIVAGEQAVISPSWSIHAGAGTAAYSFIWAMGGDNQDFKDMDHVAIGDLR